MKTILYYCLTLLLCISVCNDAEAKKKKYPNGDVYEGEWKSGQPEGRGKMFYANGDIYEGNWVNGKRHGEGKMIYKTKDIYEGEWKDNKEEGHGKMIYANGNIYEGGWKARQPNGKGKITYPNGDIYEGEWENGKDSHGKMVYVSGTIYEGKWKNDRPNGQGKMTYANGDVYECKWKNNQPEGRGQITYANGDKYECEWINGKIRLFINPNVNNISEFFGVKYGNGIITGEVKYSYANDNCSYKGNLRDYKRHGEGVFYFDDYSPNVCISGTWENDSLVSGSGDFTVLGNTVRITKEANRPFKFNIKIINDNKVVYTKDINVYNVFSMDQFYNVVYEEVKKTEVNRFDELQHQAEEKEKEKQKEKEQIRQELIKKYGVKFANAIVAKKIIVGMTKEMVSEVRSSWSSKRKDTTAQGVVEWWDYYGFFRDVNVVFVNGKVTRVSETEK